MIVEELRPEFHEAWDTYLARHPGATCYHLRAWQNVARGAYGIRAPFLIARSSTSELLLGVLPLYIIRSAMGSHATNGLFGAYADVLADTPQVRQRLIDHALEKSVRLGAKNFFLKCLCDGPPIGRHAFDHSDSWVIATLSLDPDPDRMWHGFRDKIRNSVRKALKFKLEASFGKEELPNFYDVLADNMHDKGAPIYGYPFMQRLLTETGDQGTVLTLEHRGRPIAGALLIDFKDTTYVPFASSRPSARTMSPNNLLYWEIIRRSCLLGRKTLDFGRSTRGTGPLSFKESWGAVVRPQPCYIYSTAGKPMK